jgi:hypothetical protein
MTPKQIKVPTVMLDAVLKLTLKKSKKPKIAMPQIHHRPVVMYKMISTEEWKKKDEEKKAKDAKTLATRQSPKSERTIEAYTAIKKRKRRTKAEIAAYEKQYYFKRKQYFKEYNAKRYLKLSKAKINPFDAIS